MWNTFLPSTHCVRNFVYVLVPLTPPYLSSKLIFCYILRIFCHIDFKCGSIDFHKKTQPAKYQYLSMANLKINKDSVIFVKRSFYGKGFYENGNAESKYVIIRRKQEQKEPPEVFFKKGVLKKFRKFHRKTPVMERLLIQLQVLGLYEKETQHRCFPVKLTKYLGTPICEQLFLQEATIERKCGEFT